VWRQRWINEAEKGEDIIPEVKEFLKKLEEEYSSGF
jgi:hypothetical protein